MLPELVACMPMQRACHAFLTVLQLLAFAHSSGGPSNISTPKTPEGLTCTGLDGKAVDWWAALKAPSLDEYGNTRFAYIDSTSSLGEKGYVWKEGSAIAGLAGNPVADTLAPLYNTTDADATYVIWNDEPAASHCPGCWTSVLGHSKGVMGASSGGGFWLSHSVPKFPDSPHEAAYSGIKVGQTLNGQSFLCVSLAPPGVEAIAQLLQAANLDIYSPRFLPPAASFRYPELATLARSALSPFGPVEPVSVQRSATFLSRGGERFVAFAKSSTGDGGERVRMWEDVVEPALQSGMLVQSWPEGVAADFPSFCGLPDSNFSSLVVTGVAVPSTSLAWQTRIGRFRDHSKWAVTSAVSAQDRKHAAGAIDEGVRVFCEGDNNRAQHQSVRGGTVLCLISNEAVWRSYNNIIAATQPCDTETIL